MDHELGRPVGRSVALLPPFEWQGPPLWKLILLLLVFGAFAFSVSYMAINGVPRGFRWGKNKMPVNERTVLITGGSTGMGLELGNVLSSKGANVILVARNTAKLEKAVIYIAKSAKNPSKQRFHHISADMTDPAESVRIIAGSTAWNKGLPPDIVFANAGGAEPGFFLETSIETMRQQMDLNYWSAVYLARETFKAWLNAPIRDTDDHPSDKGVRPPSRHFVMTSSTAAFCGLAGYAAYSPTKAALRSLQDQLRSELSVYNGYLDHARNTTLPKIKVHTIFPGTIVSPGLEAENRTKPEVLKLLEKDDPQQMPLDVAQTVVRELENGRSMITTNALGMLMKGSSWNGSMRDAPVKDTLVAWMANIMWIFVAPDMDKKVKRWGRENGMPLGEPRE